MKKIIFFFVILGIAVMPSVQAQSASDAVLMSQYYAGGTARSVAMGGAFGALGGDLSVLSTNPAGLGVYRGSEFTFTPAFNFTSTDASAFNTGITYNDKYLRVLINNIGYVYTKNFYNPKGFQSVSFGVAYNRLADFNSESYVRWANAKSSMLDGFVYNANVGEWSDFYEGLAYDTYALNKDQDGYYSDYMLQGNGYGEPLRHTMHTRGGIGEYDLSLAANYNHVLYFGATLGIQNVYYEESYLHEETPGFGNGLDYFDFNDEYTIDGWGVNFKAGLIYRPIPMLRLGAAVHTPTHLRLKPYHLTTMYTQFNALPSDGDEYAYEWSTESDPDDRSQLNTPWRYNASAAVVLGNFGLIGLDAEFLNYSKCSMLPKSDFQTENEDVAVMYSNTFNLKGGAEFRLGPVSLRAGAGYYGSPYEKIEGADKPKGTMIYSGGIGFRTRSFYLDAAYSCMKTPDKYVWLYDSYDNDGLFWEEAKTNTLSNKVVLTFGFKF